MTQIITKTPTVSDIKINKIFVDLFEILLSKQKWEDKSSEQEFIGLRDIHFTPLIWKSVIALMIEWIKTIIDTRVELIRIPKYYARLFVFTILVEGTEPYNLQIPPPYSIKEISLLLDSLYHQFCLQMIKTGISHEIKMNIVHMQTYFGNIIVRHYYVFNTLNEGVRILKSPNLQVLKLHKEHKSCSRIVGLCCTVFNGKKK